MEEAIIATLEHAGQRFASWLPKYKAWQGAKGLIGLTERNLTMQVATSFLGQYADGMAFMEVPFSDSPNGKEDKHLDAYLCSESLAILIESKICWAPDHVRTIAKDMDRMSSSLVSQLQKRHLGPIPHVTYGLVIGETWHPKIKERWCGNDKARPRWDRSPLSKDRPTGQWKFGAIQIHELGIDGTLYWLYGISQALHGPKNGNSNGVFSKCFEPATDDFMQQRNQPPDQAREAIFE